jgi:RNA polymerase sigma-70 factor (ECF subfamily)
VLSPVLTDTLHSRPRLVVTPDPRPSGPRQQRKLARALRRGDPRSVDLVVTSYGAMLRGYLSEALSDHGAVEDVFQQTLIEVWRRGPSFDPARGSLATWLLMIARSRAIDQMRRRVPEPYDPASVTLELDRDTEDETAALEEHWRIAGMLAALPREESQLLVLRFYEGLTQRQIAERTGIPLGTVKMKMVRALERLRTELEAEAGAP